MQIIDTPFSASTSTSKIFINNVSYAILTPHYKYVLFKNMKNTAKNKPKLNGNEHDKLERAN